ncbi:MAG: 3-phosphoshikimate 1-carboxyvinyltransferase [Alphaproteobacteria bacterium]|nr:MAG: 3-phosphoshikimate 1-carboxyvinyltransferase [Alphaproteobacteria bacterium]
MSSSSVAHPLTASGAKVLSGTCRVPGDKSISHRSLLLSGLALGVTRISGLLEGEDVLATAAAMAALGVPMRRLEDGTWEVSGVGVGGLRSPDRALDMGNSGTGARLLMGLLTSHDLTATLIGDKSLSSRPMNRVLTPLGRMGLKVLAAPGGRLPLTLKGAAMPLPLTYELPVASAQVKSAILLAGLNTPGRTTVIEPEATRDHTEHMLRHFGVQVEVTPSGDGNLIALEGQQELIAADISVPGDPSSAAFLAAAALIVPGSDLTIENVLISPSRTGFFTTVREMGADVSYLNERQCQGEPVADIRVRHSALKGVTVPAARAASMIDEYPILSVLAAYAEGTTRMEGLKELRVKESDRLAVMAAGLMSCGADVEELAEGLIVRGRSKTGANGVGLAGTGPIQTHLDHRIAMSFLILGLGAEGPVTVDDGTVIATSFPNFVPLMRTLGAQIDDKEAA